MKSFSVSRVAEAAADQVSRKNTSLFRAAGTDREAVRLFCQYASGNAGSGALRQALALRDLTEAGVEAMMQRAEVVADEAAILDDPGFAWLAPLQEIVSLYGDPEGMAADSAAAPPAVAADDPLPEILRPFAVWTFRRARALDGRPGAAAAAKAAALALQSAAAVLTDVFDVSVRAFFDAESAGLRRLSACPEEKKAYLEWLCGGGIAELVERYPMGFRLAVEALLRLLDNYAELLRRLGDDAGVIKEAFGVADPVGSLRDIELGLSDPHNGGRSVAILRYDGARIVCKPRNMAIDEAWNRLLDRLHGAFPAFSLRTLTVVNRGDYGYVSFAEQEEVRSPEAYYRSAGMLLCLASVFGATDLHYENIVATASSPVIIDLETVISPRPRDRFALVDIDKDTSHVINVGRTLLLSRWVGATAGGSREIGGLVSIHPAGKNSPLRGGRRLSAYQYGTALTGGFCELYRWILRNRPLFRELVETSGFRDCRVRYVFRRTALYAKLTRHFLQAAFLKRATLYEAVTARTGAGFAVSFTPENAAYLWPLEQAEENAIRRLDIPYFWCEGESRAICAREGQLVPDFFESTPLDLVRAGVDAMSEARLQYELHYLEKSLLLSACQPQEADSTPLVSYRDIRRQRRPADRDAIRAGIGQLYRTLDEYHLDDLEFAYFAPVRDPQTTRYNLTLLDQTLYSGIWGVMLFHAAYAVWKDDRDLREKLLRKIGRLAEAFLTGDDESLFLRTGLAEGTAGVCQALRCLSAILGTGEPAGAAAAILRRAAPFLARSRATDYFGGTAGFLYVACRICRETGDAGLLGLIRETAGLLLNSCAVDPQTGCRVWTSRSEYAPLTGLAHGQAGYAVALAEAASLLEDGRCRSVLEDLLSYEAQKYSRAHNNWYDFRRFLVPRRDQPSAASYSERFMYGLCSGTPGMGLSRIAVARALGDPGEEPVIRHAVDFCMSHDIVGCDSLCCGTSGWVDFLLEARRFCGDEALLEGARSVAASALPALSGEKWILSNLEGIYDVSLFTGISGIGYELIRTELPDRIPTPVI